MVLCRSWDDTFRLFVDAAGLAGGDLQHIWLQDSATCIITAADDLGGPKHNI